jgi:tRNA-2-methylthio-N6-dimethylallyladenosine synthase
VLGCVAQQEGEKIFERAPHVSLVCGSASYRNLPQMLTQLEAERELPIGARKSRVPSPALNTLSALGTRDSGLRT